MNQSNKQKPKIFTAHYIFLLLFFLVIFIHLFRPNSHFFIPAKCLSLFQSELISSLLAFCSNIYCNIYTRVLHLLISIQPAIYPYSHSTNRLQRLSGTNKFNKLKFWPKFGEFQAIISSNTSSLLPTYSHTLILSFWDSNDTNVKSFIIYPQI